MAYSSSVSMKKTPIAPEVSVMVYDLTDVQTDGSSTVATPFRFIYDVSFSNRSRAAAGGLRVQKSGGTLTLTAETADDDFGITVWGRG